MNTFPDPSKVFPIPDNKYFCFIKNIIINPNILIGDYTYYYDLENVYTFERNVVYHEEILGDKLVIGKFCQIGTGTKFIMNGSNHRYDGISSYPFHAIPVCANVPSVGTVKKDTVVGNDVWIGYNVTILPGICIGDGAIIGATAVVTKDVPPYTIVGGNPAREIRKRFNDEIISFIQEMQWWNWPIEKIINYAEDLTTGNIKKLKAAKEQLDNGVESNQYIEASK